MPWSLSDRKAVPPGGEGRLTPGYEHTEIVLHVGAHRTGTTALQRGLARQAGKLAAGGITFWGPRVLRGEDVGKPLPFEERGEADERGGATGLTALLAAPPPRHRLIISEENLLGTMNVNWSRAALYPKMSKQLRSLLELLPVPPRAVFVTLRDFASYWQSVFAYLVRVGEATSFDAARLSASSGNTWLPALRALRSACPDATIHVARYNRTAPHRMMAALVGPEVAKVLRPPQLAVNVSYPGVVEPPAPLFSPDETERLDRAFEDDWAEIVRGAVPGVEFVPERDPMLDTPDAKPLRGDRPKRFGRANERRPRMERTKQ